MNCVNPTLSVKKFVSASENRRDCTVRVNEPLETLKPQNRKTSMLRRIVMLIAFAIVAFVGFAVFSMISAAIYPRIINST
jgi:hypothetical protein